MTNQEKTLLTAIDVEHEKLADALADIQTEHWLSIYQLLDRPGHTTVIVATDPRACFYSGYEAERLEEWNMRTVPNDEG